MDKVKDALEERALEILGSITKDEIKNGDVKKKVDAANALIEAERQLIKDDREYYDGVNRKDDDYELEKAKLQVSKRQFWVQTGVTLATFGAGILAKFGLGRMVNKFENENYYSKTAGKSWSRDIFKDIKIKWW